MNRWFIILPAVLVAFAIASPSDFHTNFGTRVLIYSIFALSLNILVGYAGLMSLCHSAFFGLAGYGVAWLSVMKGWSAPAAIATALLLTTIVGALFGALALRAKGIGFLMITLALGQIVWGLAVRWSDLTGGENGIRGIKRSAPFGINVDGAMSFYVLTSVVFLVVCFAMYAFTRSPFGASLRGTRDQPRRMSALGFDVGLIQWIAFVFASFVAGISGVLGLYLDKFISPGVMSLTWSAEGLLMVIVGGAGAFLGPVVGTAIVLIFTHVVSSFIDRWTAALGVLFLVIVMFMPEGLVPGCRKLIERVRAVASADGRPREAS